MKQQFIPLQKQSKRKQREYHSARRGGWGGLNPVTRKPPNPKAHNRKNPDNGLNTNRRPDFLFADGCFHIHKDPSEFMLIFSRKVSREERRDKTDKKCSWD